MKPPIARLTPVDPREAWAHEALNFTPWLAANLDHLAEAIGLPLEIVGREVAVGPYSADILAQDPTTGQRVLIENQLARSDHSHLGQVLTYLAGLDAHTVVWVATGFTADHLSALKWLNDHTPPEYAFFAVTLRVVRIGDSPFAPVFDVVARPDTWARAVAAKAESAEAQYTALREAFWSRYLSRFPGRFPPTRTSNVWLPMTADGAVVLSMYVAQNKCGMFLRGGLRADRTEIRAFIDRHGAALASRLGLPAPIDHPVSGHYLWQSHPVPLAAEARWDEAIGWMAAQSDRYATAIAALTA
jgi:hypothetical protein